MAASEKLSNYRAKRDFRQTQEPSGQEAVTHRICQGIEIDPLYVDLAIRRWRRMTGEVAIHAVSGADFAALELKEIESRHA